jgi:hypothetical protein
VSRKVSCVEAYGRGEEGLDCWMRSKRRSLLPTAGFRITGPEPRSGAGVAISCNHWRQNSGSMSSKVERFFPDTGVTQG